MASFVTGRPATTEYAEFYAGYVARVPGDDVVGFLEHQLRRIERSFDGLAPTLAAHRYGEDKWSVRQVLGHVLDAERVFAYRALTFARGDQAALPGFDPDRWESAAAHDDRDAASLVEELVLVRRSNLLLFARLPNGSWRHTGVASGVEVSVRALAFILAGHAEHHLAILRERYGVPVAG